MKVIDAFWEKRNLGVETVEIEIDAKDCLEDVERTLKTLKAKYQVIKIPVGNVECMWKLEELGFKYIETTIHVTNDLRNLELTGFLKRIDDSITYQPMTEDDIDVLYEEIRKGLFYSDRIAMDPFFSTKQACERYIGWIRDEVGRGAELFKYIYKDKTIGFFIFKCIEEGVYYPFLAGIYKDFQKNPVGMVYLYKPLLEAKKRNAKCVSTFISTNNTNALRMHVQFGFSFNEMMNVYVKHV